MKQSVLSKLRRLLALSLALLLIVSLTGCFKKDNPETPDGTEDQTQTDPTGGVSSEDPTEAPTEAPAEAKGGMNPAIIVVGVAIVAAAAVVLVKSKKK